MFVAYFIITLLTFKIILEVIYIHITFILLCKDSFVNDKLPALYLTKTASVLKLNIGYLSRASKLFLGF